MHIKISMREKKKISMNHCLFLILMHLFISVHVYRPCKVHMTAFSKNDNKKPKKNKLSETAMLC